MATDISRDGSFAAGMPRRLFGSPLLMSMGRTSTLRGFTGLTRNQYDASPDGKRFLLNQLVNTEFGSPPITLVQNWTALLHK